MLSIHTKVMNITNSKNIVYTCQTHLFQVKYLVNDQLSAGQLVTYMDACKLLRDKEPETEYSLTELMLIVFFLPLTQFFVRSVQDEKNKTKKNIYNSLYYGNFSFL